MMNKKILLIISAIIVVLSGCKEEEPVVESTISSINTIEAVATTSTQSTSSIGEASSTEESSQPQENIKYDPQKGISALTGTMLNVAAGNNPDAAVISGFSGYSAMSTAASWANGTGLEQIEKALGKIKNATFDKSKSKYPIETGTMFIIDDSTELVTEKKEGFIFADMQSNGIMDIINNFADEKTHGMIKEVVTEPYDDLSKAAIVDTIYFKGTWASQFASDATSDDTFHGKNGDKTVSFMHQTQSFGTSDSLKLFEMPYKDSKVAMDVMYDINDPLEAYSAYKSAIDKGMTLDYSADIVLAMPKFETESQYDITEAFKALGIKDVFQEGTNYFEKLAKQIHISTAKQKAKIKVDEEGTEASAVTVIDMKTDAIAEPRQTKEIKVDKPFFYAIRDTETNVILFAGYVNGL